MYYYRNSPAETQTPKWKTSAQGRSPVAHRLPLPSTHLPGDSPGTPQLNQAAHFERILPRTVHIPSHSTLRETALPKGMHRRACIRLEQLLPGDCTGKLHGTPAEPPGHKPKRAGHQTPAARKRRPLRDAQQLERRRMRGEHPAHCAGLAHHRNDRTHTPHRCRTFTLCPPEYAHRHTHRHTRSTI